MHKRQAIRESVVALLKAGVPLVSNRVYESRAASLWESEELPCIAVFTKEESSSQMRGSPKALIRNLSLAVVIVVKGNAGNADANSIDDRVDAIAQEVEAVFSADPNLGNTADDAVLTATQIVYSEEGRQPIAGASLTFDVTYLTV